MGKKNFHKKGGGRQRSGMPQNWSNIDKENAAWEAYYKDQGLIPEDEFDEFKKACQTTLPLTFRITGSKRHAIDVLKSMESDYIPDLQNIEWDGEKIPAPEPIAFYPDNLAWSVKVGKQVIRKNAPFARFQRFLVVETAVGNISRQEAVSMIPPLLLDVQPEHSVLDMCAAPGSKTGQLIEALHQVDKPTGFVLANDADYKRSHMLIHQIKRHNTPNLIVTNHDAQLFPRVQVYDRYSPQPEYLKFDRVLCDVPCSGDATMRKNINVWKDWTVGNGLGLHPTQVHILQRGIQLLKPGGRLVYSTCSLNPIENEAVVAEALRANPGTMSLVDVSQELPGLKRRPGVSSWKVQAKDKQWKQRGEDPNLQDSVFAPTEEEAKVMHLDRAVRVYPHQQDTGGFFIAVFQKADNFSAAPASELKRGAPNNDAATEGTDATADSEVPRLKRYKSTDYAAAPRAEDVAEAADGALANTPARDAEIAEIEKKIVKTKKDKLPRDANEEPFKFLNPKHATIEAIWKFYGIDDKFERNTLLVRNTTGDPVRTVYYVSPQVKNILLGNEQRLKFVHAGIKMFAQQKNEGECKWRVQSEGLDLIYPCVSENRIVRASSTETLKTLCEYTFPKFSELEKIDKELHDQVQKLSEGCAFMRVPYTDEDLVFPMWRGRASVNIMLPKEYTQELLHRIFKVENLKKEYKKKDQRPLEKNVDSAGEDSAAATATEDVDSEIPEEEDVAIDSEVPVEE